MTKAIFVAMFLAMFLGAPPSARVETTVAPDPGSAATLFVDTSDLPSCLVYTDATDSEFNQVVMTTPATVVACGSTDDAMSTVNFGEALSSDAMSTQKDEVGTMRHLICHRASMANLTGSFTAANIIITSTAETVRSPGMTNDAITIGNGAAFDEGFLGQNFSTTSNVANFVWTASSLQAPAWATIVEGVAISALPARGSDGLTVAMCFGTFDACAANLA